MVIGYVFYGKLKLYSKRRFYEISLSHRMKIINL